MNDVIVNKESTELWEIVCVKARKYSHEQDSLETKNPQPDYVWLRKKYCRKQIDILIDATLEITMTPIVQVKGRDFSFFDVNEGYNQKIWTCKATSCFKQKEVDFAHSTFLEVPRDFKGRGLGTYVFNEFVKWAKQYYSDYTVKPIWLSKEQAKTEEEKTRRNRFYENFGFQPKLDQEGKSGTAEIENVDSLREYCNPEKVKAMSFNDFIEEMVNKNRESHEYYMDLHQRDRRKWIIEDALNTSKIRELENRLRVSYVFLVAFVVAFLYFTKS